jgi:prepilin-type N-terminal cleavage/methylation domain-containing protein
VQRARVTSAPHWRDQDGFTLIELTVAIAVLLVGVLGMFVGVSAAGKLSLISERHAVMAHVAEQEIERLEGMPYSQVALTSTPAHSSNTTSPDYYVADGSPPTFQWDRSSGTSEQLVVDPAGAVTHTRSWTEGNQSGSIYDYVTWTSDPHCSPGCPATQDYKRVTVAVTAAPGLDPTPVFSSSSMADPASAPPGSVRNGTSGNPLANPATKCLDANQNLIDCVSGIISGNPNTWFLHDWPAPTSDPQPPSADHATHPTVGQIPGRTCSLSDTSGCPVPDLMDATPPSGTPTTPCYHYSSDQGTTGYPCGALINPTCSHSSDGCGTDSVSDCNGGDWTNSLINVQSHLWVSAPLSASMTLTGDGALTMFSQTLGGASAVVSFCVEIYDVPPTNGVAGSLADILFTQPVALGGAAYVPETNPSTGANWPGSPTQTSFTFNYRGSQGTVSVAAGHRLGVRIWMKANVNTAIDLLYDHPQYPASLQLNSQ